MTPIANYSNWIINLAVVLGALTSVMLAALIHYEGLQLMTRGIALFRVKGRRVVLYVVLCLLALHICEIWVFGLAYHLLLMWPEIGRIQGLDSTHLFDHVYFSATVFSTVGFGDLSPVGPIRFLAGTEGLTGFLLIGWSASFTYLEMEQLWRKRQ